MRVEAPCQEPPFLPANILKMALIIVIKVAQTHISEYSTTNILFITFDYEGITYINPSVVNNGQIVLGDFEVKDSGSVVDLLSSSLFVRILTFNLSKQDFIDVLQRYDRSSYRAILKKYINYPC